MVDSKCIEVIVPLWLPFVDGPVLLLFTGQMMNKSITVTPLYFVKTQQRHQFSSFNTEWIPNPNKQKSVSVFLLLNLLDTTSDGAL